MYVWITIRMANGRTSKKHLTQNVFLFRNAIGILPTARPPVYPRLPFSIVLCALTVTLTVTLNRPYTNAIHLGQSSRVEKRESAKVFAKIWLRIFPKKLIQFTRARFSKIFSNHKNSFYAFRPRWTETIIIYSKPSMFAFKILNYLQYMLWIFLYGIENSSNQAI